MPRYKLVILTNTMIVALMASVDTNIVIIAIPSIRKHLKDTSLLDLLLVLLGYQTVVGCLLVNFGRLADMFGRVEIHNIGFIIFTVGSAMCSLSQDGTQLVVFRMIQGFLLACLEAARKLLLAWSTLHSIFQIRIFLQASVTRFSLVTS